MRVGVVGAGWAGLAAALELSDAGCEVLLWDMAGTAGGRARSGIPHTAAAGSVSHLDCGQHILIGAYTHSLQLMQRLGVDLQQHLWRGPLQLLNPLGHGLRLPGGHPVMAFLRGLAGHRGWTWGERAALLVRLARWQFMGFTCDPGWTVSRLCEGLSARVVDELIEPLCVAALNTPSSTADAQVFLRVLADGLFAGPGGSDLLIPRSPLHELLPGPALAALQRGGARVHLGRRVLSLEPVASAAGAAWQIHDGNAHAVDRVVLATSAREASRLLQPWDADWVRMAGALVFEPIVTTWVEAPGVRLPAPMVRLSDGPAQFVFDLAALGQPWPSGLSFVSSDAGAFLAKGLGAIEEAVRAQAMRLPGAHAASLRVVRSIAERRAAMACTPRLQRPPAQAAAQYGGLWVAGDYVAGPYPSTLEGAVRAGVAAAHHVNNS